MSRNNSENKLINIAKFKSAPWMLTASGELGQTEIHGKRANPQIMRYFSASRFWGKDDSGAENAWCASFVAWVMKQHGYEPVAHAYRALSWMSFGKAIDKPVMGSIAIKKRGRGGGHVGFVVGQSSTGKYLFILGGNQGDSVSIARYPANIWEAFVVPSQFDLSLSSLPIYTQSANVASSEE
jgi:uncharacterized protein (TIGR02594 family)